MSLTHKRAPITDNHGQTYCEQCGLLETAWGLHETCDRKPVLSIVPPAEASEVDQFMANPLAWIEEWTEKNGKIDQEKLQEGFTVRLWLDEVTEHPLSTGVAKSLTHAFQNAIKGLDALAFMR